MNVENIVSEVRIRSDDLNSSLSLARWSNGTLRAEDIVYMDVYPSEWVHRSLNAFNYLWQVNTIDLIGD